jgi:hypothetical protein
MRVYRSWLRRHVHRARLRLRRVLMVGVAGLGLLWVGLLRVVDRLLVGVMRLVRWWCIRSTRVSLRVRLLRVRLLGVRWLVMLGGRLLVAINGSLVLRHRIWLRIRRSNIARLSRR